jgi:hypothetical protein
MIPTIDCKGNVVNSGEEIFKALTNVGFVYLKNFGFSYKCIFKILQKHL